MIICGIGLMLRLSVLAKLLCELQKKNNFLCSLIGFFGFQYLLLWCVFGSALVDYYGLGRVLVWSNRAGLFADLTFLLLGAKEGFVDY